MNYTTLLVEKDGPVDWLIFNRPDALNSLSRRMVEELHHYFDSLQANYEVRVVVMRGAGRAFCAGLDIKDRQSANAPDPFGGGYGFQGHLADVYVKMRRCPQPIVALVQGAACGGGFAFALAADIRVAGESAKMNAAFI